MRYVLPLGSVKVDPHAGPEDVELEGEDWTDPIELVGLTAVLFEVLGPTLALIPKPALRPMLANGVGEAVIEDKVYDWMFEAEPVAMVDATLVVVIEEVVIEVG